MSSIIEVVLILLLLLYRMLKKMLVRATLVVVHGWLCPEVVREVVRRDCAPWLCAVVVRCGCAWRLCAGYCAHTKPEGYGQGCDQVVFGLCAQLSACRRANSSAIFLMDSYGRDMRVVLEVVCRGCAQRLCAGILCATLLHNRKWLCASSCTTSLVAGCRLLCIFA